MDRKVENRSKESAKRILGWSFDDADDVEEWSKDQEWSKDHERSEERGANALTNRSRALLRTKGAPQWRYKPLKRALANS